jgi:hypothetical protein
MRVLGAFSQPQAVRITVVSVLFSEPAREAAGRRGGYLVEHFDGIVRDRYGRLRGRHGDRVPQPRKRTRRDPTGRLHGRAALHGPGGITLRLVHRLRTRPEGTGLSGPPVDRYSIATECEDVDALLRAVPAAGLQARRL